MLVSNIQIIDKIVDIENDSVDVRVEFEDGDSLIVSVATVKYLLRKMDEKKSNFFEPNGFYIIVRQLTEKTIRNVTFSYAK